MQLFSGSDYLKISIANHFGKDKLDYEDRISWFDYNMPSFDTTDDIADFVKSETDLDPNDRVLAFASLCAYQDYLNNNPTGYRISLDATASGIQLMSAITCDEMGMEYTNLLGGSRKDVYTIIYDYLFKVWQKIEGEDLNLSRSDIKKAVMVMGYGGSTSIMKYLNYNNKLYTTLMQILENQLPGTTALCKALLFCKELDATGYTWKTLDGFDVKNDIIVQYKETRKTKSGTFHVKYKDLGTDKYYKANVANSIHSMDATLMREVIGRCKYDSNRLNCLRNWLSNKEFLHKVKCPKSVNSILQNLIDIFNQTGFVSVRFLHYVTKPADVVYLYHNAKDTLFEKLLALLDKMAYYEPFDVLTVHDCFTTHPNNGNYVRYWYKEVIAEFIEANYLKYHMNQLPNGSMLYNNVFAQFYKPELADKVRNQANYAIC